MSGHLVYSDFDERTVNIVMNKQISEVIRLRTWRPLRVNSIVSGDLLVTTVGDKKKTDKGRAVRIFNRESIAKLNLYIFLPHIGSVLKKIADEILSRRIIITSTKRKGCKLCVFIIEMKYCYNPLI